MASLVALSASVSDVFQESEGGGGAFWSPNRVRVMWIVGAYIELPFLNSVDYRKPGLL